MKQIECKDQLIESKNISKEKKSIENAITSASVYSLINIALVLSKKKHPIWQSFTKNIDFFNLFNL